MIILVFFLLTTAYLVPGIYYPRTASVSLGWKHVAHKTDNNVGRIAKSLAEVIFRLRCGRLSIRREAQKTTRRHPVKGSINSCFTAFAHGGTDYVGSSSGRSNSQRNTNAQASSNNLVSSQIYIFLDMGAMNARALVDLAAGLRSKH